LTSELQTKLQKISRAPFPRTCYKEILDIDLVLLDSETFGVLQKFVQCESDLSKFLIRYQAYPTDTSSSGTHPAFVLVRRLLQKVELVMPALDEDGIKYFGLHRDLLAKVIEKLEMHTR